MNHPFFRHDSFTQKDAIRIGSRKSQLALIQTNHVIERLKELNPEKKYEIVKMHTLGDQILDKPLPKIGEKSLFTKELEIALEQQDVDFVVHSLKDLPTALPDGMCIGAILKREDPRDALVLHPKHKGKCLQTLPKGSVVGTSSLRRTAQLKRNYPNLKVENIRGNLNTRLKKLDNGDSYEAIILAAAGMTRMGWDDRISQRLEAEELLYAVGQGALAIECREDDFATLQMLEPLFHGVTTFRVLAERSFLRTLEGGCSAPVAVYSQLVGQTLSLTGAVWSLDGVKTLKSSASCRLMYREEEEGEEEPPRKCPYRMPKLFCSITPGNFTYRDLESAEKLGEDLAMQLIGDGALEIMAEAKKQNESTSIDIISDAQNEVASTSSASTPSETAPTLLEVASTSGLKGMTDNRLAEASTSKTRTENLEDKIGNNTKAMSYTVKEGRESGMLSTPSLYYISETRKHIGTSAGTNEMEKENGLPCKEKEESAASGVIKKAEKRRCPFLHQ